MKIIKIQDGTNLTVKLEGRLDTTTAPSLETELNSCIPDAETLTFDLGGIEYISSAGLRVLLYAQKKMRQKGGVKVKNVTNEVMEIFDVTGFSDILDIE
jgi:anti-sigma B factor antagonist